MKKTVRHIVDSNNFRRSGAVTRYLRTLSCTGSSFMKSIVHVRDEQRLLLIEGDGLTLYFHQLFLLQWITSLACLVSDDGTALVQ